MSWHSPRPFCTDINLLASQMHCAGIDLESESKINARIAIPHKTWNGCRCNMILTSKTIKVPVSQKKGLAKVSAGIRERRNHPVATIFIQTYLPSHCHPFKGGQHLYSCTGAYKCEDVGTLQILLLNLADRLEDHPHGAEQSR